MTVVDLSLKDIVDQCEDPILIQDDERTLYSSCEGLQSPLSIVSVSVTKILKIWIKTMENKQ